MVQSLVTLYNDKLSMLISYLSRLYMILNQYVIILFILNLHDTRLSMLISYLSDKFYLDFTRYQIEYVIILFILASNGSKLSMLLSYLS